MALWGMASLVTAKSRSYQAVLSIGPQCLTSNLLKRARLKAFSGPFDWIFSSLSMVADCIETNFADLLNVDFIKPVPLSQRPDAATGFAQHLLYRERYDLQLIFNHYDPREPEKYAYLRRCVRRMRVLLASQRAQLLLAVCRPDNFDRAAMMRLFELLDAGTVAVEAWIILVNPSGDGPSLTLTETYGRHRVYRFDALSGISGIQFADGRDNAFLVAQWRALIMLDGQPLDFAGV